MVEMAPPELKRSQSSFESNLPVSVDWIAESKEPERRETVHLRQAMAIVESTVCALDDMVQSALALGGHIPELPLSGLPYSLVAVERLLFEYVDDMVRRLITGAADDAKRRGTVFSASPSAKALKDVGPCRERGALKDLTRVLTDAVALLDPDSAAARALPGPLGGVMMLLEYLSRALDEGNAAMADVRRLRGGFDTTPVACAAACCVATRGDAGGARAVSFFLLGCAGLRLARARWRRSCVVAKLAAVDSALQTSIRLWVIVTHTLDNGLRLKRQDQSYCTLLVPVNPQKRPGELLVEQAPCAPTLSFWYSLGAAWQVQLMERLMLGWMGANRAASEFVRTDDWPWPLGAIAEPLTLACAIAATPAYLACPQHAAHQVAAGAARPSVASLRRQWAMLDWRVLVASARLTEKYFCGLELQADVSIDGVLCTVCARGETAREWKRLRGMWERDPHHVDASDDDFADASPGCFAGFDVVVHVHGGAFVQAFEACHWRWFNELARYEDGNAPNGRGGALVIMPQYTLEPSAKYPTAIEQTLRVYDAVSQRCDIGLQPTRPYDSKRRRKAEMRYDLVRGAPRSKRANVKSLTCSGESAGACILASVIARVAKRRPGASGQESPHSPAAAYARLAGAAATPASCRKSRMPDALLLVYPPLNLLACESPSRIVHACDMLLPMNVLICCAEAYGTRDEMHDDVTSDMMAYYAADEVLRRFPPTLLLCGGTDPLLDDSCDFHTRLKRLGVDSHLLVHRKLSHGFLGMLPLGPLCPPHAAEFAKHAVRFLARAAKRALPWPVDEAAF
ncbi:Alpha/Beta hydrolase protein [Pelagophyceae sp. CCMP2097]|nr:Alpha/Beta hydrolase protein [Pelagophyceae sp. CCMP2097]